MKWLKSFLGIFFKKYRTTYSVSFNDKVASDLIKKVVDEKPRFFKLKSSKYKNCVYYELQSVTSVNNNFYFKLRNVETLQEITFEEKILEQKFLEVQISRNVLKSIDSTLAI